MLKAVRLIAAWAVLGCGSETLQVEPATSQLSLGVSVSDVPMQRAIDVEAFEALLAQQAGASIEARWNTGALRYAKIGTLVSAVRAGDRYVHVADSRGYADAEGPAPPDGALVATTTTLLEAMGIDVREVTMKTVGLGAQVDPSSDVERMGTKVFCFRAIGGIAVGGSRMVFSYASDGSLRALRGAWPHVNVQASQWSTELSGDEIIARALDAMVVAGASTESTWPVTFETFYALHEAADGTWALRLRVAAVRASGGHDGSGGRGVRYEAEL